MLPAVDPSDEPAFTRVAEAFTSGVAYLVRRRAPPRLTPSDAHELDIQRQYDEWSRSAGAATFERLAQAGRTAQRSEGAAERLWERVTPHGIDDGPRQAALEEATPLITDSADALSAVWEHADAPFALPPMRSWDEPLHLAGFRALAYLLGLDAHRRLSHGDRDGALEMSLIGLRFGLQIARGGNLVGRLVSCEAQSIARHAFWPALPHASPDALRAALRELQSALADAPPFGETLAEEKRFLLRMLLGAWQKVSPAQNAAPIPDLGMHLATLFRGKQYVFDECGAYLDRWREVARGPYRGAWERPDPPSALESSVWHGIEGTYLSHTLQTTENHLALTVLALHLYRAEQQHWPSTLDALISNYLPSVPADPFARSGPLHYQLDGDGYRLHSIGPDGNDDRGRPIPYPLPVAISGSGRSWESVRGDIVAGVNL